MRNKGGRRFNMTNLTNMPHDLATLFMPQVEQLGVRLTRQGVFWLGTADGERSRGSMWVTALSPYCLVLRHTVVPRANMRLVERSASPYACVCSMSDPARACSRDARLPMHLFQGTRGMQEKREGSFATFVERAPRAISSQLSRGRDYRSCSILLLPGYFDELGRMYPDEYDGLFSLFGSELEGAAQGVVEQALARIPAAPPTGAGGALMLKALVDGMVARLAEHAVGDARGSGADAGRSLAQRAQGEIVRAIQAGCPPPTADQLAKSLYVSRSQLYAAFKRETGSSPGSYGRLMRMQRATELLSDSDRPIKDVAEALGYPSMSAFDHAFKHETGLSPQAWRELGGSGA